MAFLDQMRRLFAGTQPLDEADAPADPARVRVATCVLLMEVAKTDDGFSDAERGRVVETLRERFDLSEAEANELMVLSATERGERNDLWYFTRAINEQCTVPEKRGIMKELWRIIYADGTLHSHEDYLAHKLARLLNLTHPQMIEAKLKVKQELDR